MPLGLVDCAVPVGVVAIGFAGVDEVLLLALAGIGGGGRLPVGSVAVEVALV